MSERAISVTIEGTTPLLQHRYPMAAVQPVKRRVGPPEPPPVEESLYKDGDGKVCQPADHIRAALKKAAARFRIGGRGRRTWADAILSTISITPDMIPHEFQEWVVDVRPVVVQRARIPRHRPKLERWRLSFTATILDEALSPETLQEILAEAGKNIGIGDNRTNGFGRFRITRLEERR